LRGDQFPLIVMPGIARIGERRRLDGKRIELLAQ
jgi:hypothetical protein